MNASENSKLNNAEILATEIVARLDRLYPKIAPVPVSGIANEAGLSAFGAPQLDMPPVEVLSDRVARCSFKVFDSPAAYFQNPRAKEYVSWSVPRSDVYRIYFNAYSKKVYIDLNGTRWEDVRSKLEEELLFCDILRTLIWVLTCEVEIFEAREAEQSSAAVTSEVVEVVIPPKA